MNLQQKTRFSKDEMDLIKNTFKGKGENILYQIRDIFMQFSDKTPTLSEDVLKIIRKAVIPELSVDVPWGCQAVTYGNLLEIIRTYPPEIAHLHIESQDLVNQYLEQRYRVLEGKGINPSDLQLESFKQGDTVNDRVVNMLAYLRLTKDAYIDSCLASLSSIANAPELSEEQKKLKAEKDSTK